MKTGRSSRRAEDSGARTARRGTWQTQPLRWPAQAQAGLLAPSDRSLRVHCARCSHPSLGSTLQPAWQVVDRARRMDGLEEEASLPDAGAAARTTTEWRACPLRKQPWRGVHQR